MKYLSIFLYILLFVVLSGEINYEEKSGDQLDKYLAGSAEYCEKLRSEAFHFYCKEQILLEMDEFILGQNRRGRLYRNRSSKKYLFDYQIIQKNKKLTERRRLILGNRVMNESNPSDLLLSFLSEKAVFGPNSILDKTRQDNFNFKILKSKIIGDNEFVVIEAIPKEQGKVFFISAQIYINKTNFSVRKIVVTPVYITGYDSMKRTAAYYKARLYLDCQIRFDQEYKGLFFPTFIHIIEKYKGGSIINRNVGSKGWEKSKTTFTYSDYKFFDVDTEVKIKN